MNIRDSGLKPLGEIRHKKSTEIKSSRLGVGFETLDRDMWNIEHAWPVLETLGVKWARVQSGWTKSEKNKGIYNFTWLDEIVDKLLERGVQPWLSLSYGNRLYTPQASEDGVGYVPMYTETERQGWRNYVMALTQHYHHRVNHYEIWNEPDAGFFKPKPNPVLYTKFVSMTAQAIKEISPDSVIIGGAMAQAMTPSGLEFLEQCFKHGMNEYINIVSYHGYKYLPEQYAEQEFPAFKHLLKKYAPQLKYWQGETGCPSKVPPGNTQAMAQMRVDEDIQARWLARRILIELGFDAGLVSYFNMGDFTRYLFDGELGYTSHYGLLRMEDGSPKPAFYALQALATMLHDPLKPAEGRFSFRMQTGDDDKAVTREQAAAALQVNLVRENIPVHAWWLREAVENTPQWQSITMYYWLDESVNLPHPVLIEPISGQVFELEYKRNYGMNEFANLPISNSPVILTDRSIIKLKNKD